MNGARSTPAPDREHPSQDGIAPLDGITVIEVGGQLAGALVGSILASLGARVLKVVRPSVIRTRAVRAADRAKQVLAIDLTDKQAAARVRQLIVEADIFIENGRPGRLDRFGLDAQTLALDAPQLVHLTMPGFSAVDARNNCTRPTEAVLAAAAGLVRERGLSHALRRAGCAVTPMPMASAYGAGFGALAALIALIARARAGHGARVEVALFDALLEGLSYNHLAIEALPQRYCDRRARALATEGRVSEERLQALIDPIYRSYRCSDGEYFYLATPPHHRLLPATLSSLGVWGDLVRAGLPCDDPYLSTSRWANSREGSIFAPPKMAEHWFERQRSALTEVFGRKAAAAWEAEFIVRGLAGARVRTAAEWSHDRHALGAGLIEEWSDDGAYGSAPGKLCWLRPMTGQPAHRLSPLGPERPLRPLEGITILDLANVIAGPTVAGILARFGADVIKLDPPNPGFDPYISVVLALQYGQGKRSLLLDLAAEDGKETLEHLLKQVDLVTFNGLASQMTRLGLGPDALAAVPGLSCVRVSAFGGARAGPEDERKGFDEVLQAATGIMTHHREGDYPPEEFAQFGCVDVITGVLGATGAAAALYHRVMTGQGSIAETSLAAGAELIQFPLLCLDGKGAAEPGRAPLILELCDGEFLLDEDETGIARFYDVLNDSVDKTTLAQARAICRTHDLAGQEIRTFAMLRELYSSGTDTSDATCGGAGVRFAVRTDHPIGHAVTLLRPGAIRCGQWAHVPLALLEKPGQSSVAVLNRAGFAATEIERLFASGSARAAWPAHDMFLPD